MRRLPRLIWNESMILARDAGLLFWIFLFPLLFMFMLLFAYGAHDSSLPRPALEIVDLDRSALSRQYIAALRLAYAGDISVAEESPSGRLPEATAARTSRITLPEGFGQDLGHQQRVVVHVTVEPDVLAPRQVLEDVRAVSRQFQLNLMQQVDWLDVRSGTSRAGPGIQFAHYVLTGTMVMAMMSAGMTSICSALAYRRERNGFKLLACMPLAPCSFLLGMLLAKLAALVLAALILVLCGHYLFGVDLPLGLGTAWRGGVVVLLGGSMLLALGTLLGARLASVSAANFVTSLVYLALLLLSDLTMPLSAMAPDLRAWLSHLPPALFVNALRHVFILGESLAQNARGLAEMTGWLLTFSLSAVALFRWHRQ